MASNTSARLHLFPQPAASSMPRKSSLKQKAGPSSFNCTLSSSPNEVKGTAVAIRVSTATTRPAAPHVIQPANDRVRHLSRPDQKVKDAIHVSATTTTSPRGSDSLQSNNPFKTSIREKKVMKEELPFTGEDILGPLPEHKAFGQLKPSGRRGRTQIVRPSVPARISTEVRSSLDSTPLTPQDDDKLSPLPHVTQFKASPPRNMEFPSHVSERSESPTLVRSNSAASHMHPSSPPAMQSMFPQYDPSKTLGEQKYFPSVRSRTPSLPSAKVSKVEPPVERHSADDAEMGSTSTFVDGYEHILRATDRDMTELWKASCSHFPVAARKLLLGLHQPKGKGTRLTIGTPKDTGLYSMSKDDQARLVIKKHCPGQTGFTPVAQLELPDPDLPRRPNSREDVVRIFPQMAAVHAQHTTSNPLSISAEEPSRLSSDNVISTAYATHTSRLIRTMRKRDSLGAVTASYTLKHPSHGSFAVTITKSTRGGRHLQDPRAKISLHHPLATPNAIAAETLVLAFLDFARDACVLDVPALLALDGPYVVDTVVAALLAVAVIENDSLMAETMTFAPPPRSPLSLPPASAKRKSLFLRGVTGSSVDLTTTEKRKSRGLFRKKKKSVQEKEDELPAITQGALALLGFSFKTAVFVLEAGVKVTAGVVVGVSHLASKA